MENNNKQNKKKKGGFNIYWIYGIFILVILMIQLFGYGMGSNKEIDYKKFIDLADQNVIEKLVVVNRSEARVYIKKSVLNSDEFKDISQDAFSLNEPYYTFNIGTVDALEGRLEDINENLDPENKLYPTYKNEYSWTSALTYIIPIVLIIGIWIFIMRRMSGGAGGPGAQIFNIGKSKATLFDKNTRVNVTFKDVAGLDEAKEEVMEVVDFLKNPKKYTTLGGKIPKGVLLVGPPGTGKTLLAKAVAGEAEVPFFSISGSDFVEMFVGVGASRVRDLFRQAREKAPCIIFIDEIDAIGRTRGRNSIQGGNDERENTLNQLLVEMDGFSSEKGVILMAATNRPDVLDIALLRPGRFDRQIGIDRPDLHGREQIFRVHLQHIKINDEVSSEVLAEMTPGFAGAEIANVCNEAALIAARRSKKSVDMEDFNYALDKVIGGLEKKNKLISPGEKKVIAYHEAGHAICGWFLEHASPLVKVTIVPRGIGTLGYAQYLPKEEYITSTEQLLDRMCMTFGGRAAESIIFGRVSTGAQNDLDQITKMAYSMIAVYGMNEKVGNVSFHGMQKDQINRPYSEETSSLIDEEVRIMVKEQFERAKNLLLEKRHELEILAQALLEQEVILKSDLEKMIGPRPYPEPEKIRLGAKKDVVTDEEIAVTETVGDEDKSDL